MEPHRQPAAERGLPRRQSHPAMRPPSSDTHIPVRQPWAGGGDRCGRFPRCAGAGAVLGSCPGAAAPGPAGRWPAVQVSLGILGLFGSLCIAGKQSHTQQLSQGCYCHLDYQRESGQPCMSRVYILRAGVIAPHSLQAPGARRAAWALIDPTAASAGNRSGTKFLMHPSGCFCQNRAARVLEKSMACFLCGCSLQWSRLCLLGFGKSRQLQSWDAAS